MPLADTQGKAPAKLTPKQIAFIALYLANGMNATRAAKDAGYAAKSADTQGSRLLANPLIAAELAKAAKKTLAKREITADWVLDQIAKVAELNLREVKASDKLKALELLGRYLKLFTDKVEHSGSLGVQLITTVPRPLRGVIDASRKGESK